MQLRYELLLNPLVLLCTLLLAVIPTLIYHFNKYLHKRGDPPWMQHEECDTEELVTGNETNK